MTDRDALADSVTAARFPSVRLRRGYAMGDVDAFITELSAAVRAGARVRERIDTALFKQAVGGYDMRAVDDFLDRTAAAADGSSTTDLRAPVPTVVAESPSAISPGDGDTGSPTRVVPVVVTIMPCGVVAGVVALVVRNLRPDTSFQLWPTVLVGCAFGLVYEVEGVLVRAGRC